MPINLIDKIIPKNAAFVGLVDAEQVIGNSDLDLGTYGAVVHRVQADASDGLLIEAGNGTDVAILGAGNTANSTFYGNISMNTTQKIVNMADPSSAQDAATKNYVDTNFGNVTLAGTPDYITISGQTITRGLIDLTTDVTGVLPDANIANDITLDNITQITNRSHTSLSDIGSNTHAQIDTHIATSNTHVDHTAVILTAGTGISGGGDISVSRTFDFAPSELSTVTPTTSDEFVLADVSDSDNPKVATLSSIATAINSSIDHGTLAGLADDDHTQYALLAGRSGGQTINGTTAGTNYFKITSAGKVEISSTSGQNNSLYHAGTEYLRVNSTGITTLNGTMYVTNGANFGYIYSGFDNDTDRVTGIRVPRVSDYGASVLMGDDYDDALFLDQQWDSVTYSTSPSSGKTESPFRASAAYLEWASGSIFPLVITYDFNTRPIPAEGNGYYQVGILMRFDTGVVVTNLQVEIWDGSAYQTVYNAAVTTQQLVNEFLTPRFLSPEPSYNFNKLRLTFSGTNPIAGAFRLERISIRHATSRQINYCVNRAGDSMFGTLSLVHGDTDSYPLALRTNGTWSVGTHSEMTWAEDYNINPVAGIRAIKTAASDVALDFLTTTGGAGAYAERMRIAHNGYVRIGTGTTDPTANLELVGVSGTEVERIRSTATNDDPTRKLVQNRVATTNATVTTIETIAVPSSTTIFIEAYVVARRTGGVSGTAEDGAGYIVRGTYKNSGGTATVIGAVSAEFTAESQAGWDCTLTVSSGNVLLRVTGAAGNNVTWHSHVYTYAVGS